MFCSSVAWTPGLLFLLRRWPRLFDLTSRFPEIAAERKTETMDQLPIFSPSVGFFLLVTAACIDCFLKKTGLKKCSVCVQLLKDMFRLWSRGSGEECVYCGYVGGAMVKGVCAVVM